jgi:hypothetical protein
MSRVIVAGGRDYTCGPNFLQIMEQFVDPDNDTLICGMAPGADTEALNWMMARRGAFVKYPADWARHGKAAGPIRNKQMADNADVLVAFWDGESAGTANMIRTALNNGLEVHVYHYEAA